ncbi:hypothetical protein P43SY_004744 [Pythium insidiosum]|uniref:Uncharacterized protein n=1 Tax=Pythium insidiosum TaxID=114742 RepID=A0AAD5LW57_PYTIN|nr:hypothetical protein P43SY_004744 [Pythium insidiosum]
MCYRERDLGLIDALQSYSNSVTRLLAQDGGGHDPRFRLDSVLLFCACGELPATQPRPVRLCDPTLAYPPSPPPCGCLHRSSTRSR